LRCIGAVAVGTATRSWGYAVRRRIAGVERVAIAILHVPVVSSWLGIGILDFIHDALARVLSALEWVREDLLVFGRYTRAPVTVSEKDGVAVPEHNVVCTRAAVD